MNQLREKAHRALKRLLVNGPLTAVPKRLSDQKLLVALAASQFEAQRTYREDEVNEKLKAWLQGFCEPFGIDHVTLRRLLVDSRRMSRTSSGSAYRLNLERIGETETVRTIDPVHVLAEIRNERESRKRKRAT
ncbi:MAG: DUF2087 domain-containing protein [Betaproteobacteria bacterium]|nr:DUF2087 domain-containing protein [Betaproteobacteria bacterium]